MHTLSMLFNMADPIIIVNIPNGVREQADISKHAISIIKRKVTRDKTRKHGTLDLENKAQTRAG